ncbi:DUF3006 domain-containing protein [Ruminococcus sp.]|uniref:DUF3006 domain-containing protein n=1 Tax=Ruminococcus sp. TaxID=41978 RepID=UPI0025FE6F72|nr:DUF3006 domain-containing protein [Ruminococcus sp.]MBQ8967563.1 DUF3006 domain-containing protein [Ruminococcus sp.]
MCEKGKEIIIDRIESSIAVCEDSSGAFTDIKLDDLPCGVKTGDILVFDGEAYVIDRERTLSRKKKIMSMQQKLFGRGAPKKCGTHEME